MHYFLQTPHFQILSVHDNVVETEEHWVPWFDHRIINCLGNARLLGRQGCRYKPTFGCAKHGRNNTLKHADGEETNFLEFADFAEISDAHREIREGSIRDNIWEPFFVQSCDDIESGGHHAFLSDRLVLRLLSENRGNNLTCKNFGCRREHSKHGSPSRSHIVST